MGNPLIQFCPVDKEILEKLQKRLAVSEVRFGKKKKAPKPKINRGKLAFEQAFYKRIGQTPADFIATKLAAGSDLKSTNYLFDITAAAIAQQYHCIAGDFSDYYHPKVKEVAEVPKVIKYNKLVRDRIPEIIEKSGKKCIVTVLAQDEYIKMLDAKLQEELTEYQESKSLEELADLLEVMGAVVKARGHTWDELTQVRKAKRDKRGGFEKKLLLTEVIED